MTSNAHFLLVRSLFNFKSLKLEKKKRIFTNLIVNALKISNNFNNFFFSTYVKNFDKTIDFSFKSELLSYLKREKNNKLN